MATNSGGIQQRIMEERQRITDDGDPLFEGIEIELGKHGQNGSLKHTVPNEAVRIMGLSADDSVKIDVYQNGYIVQKQ